VLQQPHRVPEPAPADDPAGGAAGSDGDGHVDVDDAGDHDAGNLARRRRDHPDRWRRPGRPAPDLTLRQAEHHRRRRLLQPLSLLASIENLFGMHRLGYAGISGLPVFGLGVFNAYSG
jgi:hypothetical protein